MRACVCVCVPHLQVTFEQGDILLVSMMDPSRQLQWANDIDIVSSEEKKPSQSESFSIVREFMVAMTLQWHSPLVGQSVLQAGLRGLPGLYLASLEREGGEVFEAFFCFVFCPWTLTNSLEMQRIDFGPKWRIVATSFLPQFICYSDVILKANS